MNSSEANVLSLSRQPTCNKSPQSVTSLKTSSEVQTTSREKMTTRRSFLRLTSLGHMPGDLEVHLSKLQKIDLIQPSETSSRLFRSLHLTLSSTTISSGRRSQSLIHGVRSFQPSNTARMHPISILWFLLKIPQNTDILSKNF